MVKIGQCSPVEERFCLFVAQGRLPTQAYRMSWGATKNADALSANVMKRRHVQARIAELQEEIARRAISDAILSAKERRELLAQTARSVGRREKATHGERIRALELDAKLAGDLTDRVQVSGEIDLRACFVALGGTVDGAIPVAPVHEEPRTLTGPAVAPPDYVEPPLPDVDPVAITAVPRAVAVIVED